MSFSSAQPAPAGAAGEGFAAPAWFGVPLLAALHLAIIVASNYLVQWPVQTYDTPVSRSARATARTSAGFLLYRWKPPMMPYTG